MSALDLDALEQRCKDTIVEWTLVYVQSGETLPDDAVETKAARETLALITRLRAAEARTAPVAVHLFRDQIDADRVALDWTADVPAESMPDRSTWRLEQGLGRVTATWSTRDGRRALTRLAVIVRDDFNHAVLVTVDTGPERAEARTAWQPIETAPGAWVVGRRADMPPVVVVDMDRGLLGHPPRFVDEHGIRQHITAWAPLPAAPEAP